MSRCYKTRSKKLRVIKKKGNKSKRKYRVKTRKNRVKTRKNRVKTRKSMKGGSTALYAAQMLPPIALLAALFYCYSSGNCTSPGPAPVAVSLTDSPDSPYLHYEPDPGPNWDDGAYEECKQNEDSWDPHRKAYSRCDHQKAI